MTEKLNCPKCGNPFPKQVGESYPCSTCGVVWRITVQATMKPVKVCDIWWLLGILDKKRVSM